MSQFEFEIGDKVRDTWKEVNRNGVVIEIKWKTMISPNMYLIKMNRGNKSDWIAGCWLTKR